MAKSIEYLVKKRDILKTQKQVWERQFQILGQYVFQRKSQFDIKYAEGAFLNDGMLNDSTAARALQAMCSAILGSLWKSGGRTFRLKRPKHIPDTTQNKNYYEEINRRIYQAMESEKAGFELAMHENLLEQGCFGTGTLGVFKGDYKTPLIYKCWTMQACLFAQSKDEFIDTLYYDEKLTVEQVVNRYGIDNVSKSTREKFEKESESSKQDTVIVCIAVEPRFNYEKDGRGAMGMDFASCHFEVDNKHKLYESGYNELPVKPSRWYKLANEVFGRSPAMDALPAIMQLNALKEAFLIGVEKKVEPPLFVLDDGSLGASTVDTSAGGLSVFNMSGRVNANQPVGVIFDIGELQSVNKAIEDTALEISQHFLIDKLYDLNNKTRMTLGEAQIRYEIRADSLTSIYSRIFNEQLSPIIERSFNIMLDMGLLGVAEEDVFKQAELELAGVSPIILPSDIIMAGITGKDIYEIEYISPAARILREEEKRGVFEVLEIARSLAEIDPGVLEDIDTNVALNKYRDLSGAPPEILRSKQEADGLRRAKQEAMAEQAKAENMQKQAEVFRSMSQGQAMTAAAQRE
jgi:hypothetical protein